MAASARICCGGGTACSLNRESVRPACVVPISGLRSRRCCSGIGKISMSMSMSTAEVERRPPAVKPLEGMRRIGDKKNSGGRGGAVVSLEKLDEWTRDSVSEIVKNLRESPLLVHVYAGTNGDLTTTAAEKAEDWPATKKRWEKGEERMPEGVIFVEELEDVYRDPIEENGGDEIGGGVGGGGYGEGTKAWGIVAQGRGIDCGPVCYLLKTTRVGSGVGPFCTHFCLTKVKSFRETAMSQLNNCWLVQSGQ